MLKLLVKKTTKKFWRNAPPKGVVGVCGGPGLMSQPLNNDSTREDLRLRKT